jgi:translation initiation factor IF-3
VSPIRLVGVESEQLGIVSLREALMKAEEAELDLVEIAPTGATSGLPNHGLRQIQIPGKQEAARSQAQAEADPDQGSQIPACTDDNDYQVKLRNLIRFLEEGDKAKITLRFRGREMAHQEFGMQLLKRVEGGSGRTWASSSSFPSWKAAR